MNVSVYRCGEFHLEVANRRLFFRGVPLSLEPKTFSVLLLLVSRSGALVTRNELLDEVWGHRYVTPSTLNRVITLVRRAFSDDADEPKYIETAHGAGYRYIGPIQREDSERSDSPLRFAPSQAARLPARTAALIGRELELAALTQFLATHRSVTVLGSGGMGKTHCALEWARRFSGDFPDGIWFFDAAPMRSGIEWLNLLAGALGITSAPSSDPFSRIVELLQGRRALLLIDNCDRVATGIGAIAVELLRGTDTLKILATSQAPLQFLGEKLMRMPPLGLPSAAAGGMACAQEVAAAPAAEMLLARIAAVQPGFALSDSNASSIAEICRHLDGMPLALELAAARFALLSAEEVLRRLTQRFQFLRSNVAGRESRHRNLTVLLDWSVALLSAEEQRLLNWLSVFVGGWTVEAALDLAVVLRSDPETIVELLSGLVDKSLISVDPSTDPQRYHLLETVREYAGEQLSALGEEQQARDAHLACVVQMSRSAHDDMVNGRMGRRVARLLREEGNIARALDYALASESRHNSALAILGYLTLYLKARGDYRRTLMLGWAAAQKEVSPTIERARALLCIAVMSVHVRSEAGQVTPLLEEATRLAQLHGDAWIEGYACGYRALLLVDVGRHEEADSFADEVLRIATERNNLLLLGLAALTRGWVHLARGDCASAIHVMQSARDLGDDPHQRHFLHMYIGLALFRLGDYGAAACQWREGMRGAAAVSNTRGLGGAIEGCGYLAEQLGHANEAVRMLTAAHRLRQRTEMPLFSHWLPHHESAIRRLRSTLGPTEYAVCVAAGEALRIEDAVNETTFLLQRFGACTEANSVVATA